MGLHSQYLGVFPLLLLFPVLHGEEAEHAACFITSLAPFTGSVAEPCSIHDQHCPRGPRSADRGVSGGGGRFSRRDRLPAHSYTRGESVHSGISGPGGAASRKVHCLGGQRWHEGHAGMA